MESIFHEKQQSLLTRTLHLSWPGPGKGWTFVAMANVGYFERLAEPVWFSDVGLGLRLWEGRFEDLEATWLRWVDAQCTLIPTGAERAEAERQRADRLAEKLRRLGVDPQTE